MNNILVYVSTGSELDVFRKCETLWEIWRKLHPQIKVFFVSYNSEICSDSVLEVGDRLMVGYPSWYTGGATSDSEYAQGGVWGKEENQLQIYRHIAALDFFSQEYSSRFNWIYHSTVTSIIDLYKIGELENILKENRCFSGMIGRLSDKTPFVPGLCFVCGTNSIISFDVCKELVSRYKKNERKFTYFPNDIWQSLLLHDFERTLIPFFSFSETRLVNIEHEQLRLKISKAIDHGHIHFRFKLNTHDPKERCLNDPILMQELIGLLSLTGHTGKARTQLESLLEGSQDSFPGLDVLNLPSHMNRDQFFSGPRRCPYNDMELS